MTYGAYLTRDVADYGRRSRKTSPYPLVCAMVLTIGGAVGATILYSGTPAEPPRAETTTFVDLVPAPVAPKTRAASMSASANPMFDPAPTTAFTATQFGQSMPLGSGFALLSAPAILTPAPEVTAAAEPAPQDEAPVSMASAEPDVDPATAPPQIALPQVVTPDIPLPLPRPASLGQTDVPRPSRRSLAALAPTAAPSPATNPGGLLDTFFGTARAPALAYAAPEDRGLGRPVALGRMAPERGVAVYNIASHTVTLPNGARLEAHSGLGSRLDDPRSVTEHMRGATPPNVYDLTLREAPFHGVRALRLTPIAGTTYGRGGLLAHTFMLGPRGDSNGCVVFRNYAAFLQAYEAGEIRRLMVVAGT